MLIVIVSCSPEKNFITESKLDQMHLRGNIKELIQCSDNDTLHICFNNSGNTIWQKKKNGKK